MKNFKIFVSTFLIFLATVANANNLLETSSIYIDKTRSLSIEDIKNVNFIENKKESLSYGYSPNFDVWIKFTLHNDTDKTINKLLEYGNPLTTHIELYDDQKVYKEGLFFINPNRITINPTFDIILKPNESKTYYLKASSHIVTLIIKLNLYEKEEYLKKELHHQMILAAFFATILILAFYNFFIYFFTKDKNYLFYVWYLFGIVFHQLVYTGFANIYLLSQDVTIFVVQNSALVVAIPIFLFALLVRSFLSSDQYKIWDKVLSYYLYIFPFLTLLFLITDRFLAYRNLFSIILLLLLMSLTFYATYKKNRQAYFVLVGWIMFALASLFMYLSSIGKLDIFTTFPYLVEVTLVLEAIIFSLALADKIKQLEDKKNRANMELILQEELEKNRLKSLVSFKTKELQDTLTQKELLLKELNHRVKNNMQTIVSLIRLQNDNIDDQQTQEILTTIQNRIQAMGHLHELLYKQNDIAYINTQEYFSLILEEIKDSFESENITIKYDISTSLKVEDAVYCGLILNELVTNSYKYAFQGALGVVNISLKKSFDNYYVLSISDDGVGYEESSIQDTLGLTLVDILATKQLKGKIEKHTTKGVKVMILWN